jgi:hypothetical protein
MEIVDAQIHATHRGLEQSIAIMDAMGVSAAVLDDWPPTRQKLPEVDPEICTDITYIPMARGLAST